MKTPYCKYCNSTNVVKFGTFNGIQRWWCKDCKRKFVAGKLPKMKTPTRQIADAMSMYYGGMPLDSIQRHLYQEYDRYYSESGIYNWIVRFSKEAVERAKSFKPIVGDTWIADGTVLKVGGRKIWFFDVIDEKTRYLLASRLATSRTTKEAALVMNEARRKVGKSPKRIITDRLAAYIDGIELVFGADTKHIQSKPFTDVNSTNIIERFQGTLKDRTKIIRGFKNMRTAELLTDAWLVHYNFFKEHEALGNIPPAQKMGIPTPFKNWAEVVSQPKVAISPKIEIAKEPKEVSRLHHPPEKRKHRYPEGAIYTNKPRTVLSRHPFRGARRLKPKGLKQRAYTEITVSTMRK